jgi:protein TonB
MPYHVSLIESHHGHFFHAGETSLSLLVHGVIIGTALVFGPAAGEKLALEAPEMFELLLPPPASKAPPPAALPPAPAIVRASVGTPGGGGGGSAYQLATAPPPVAKGFQVLLAPGTIPDRIPDVDLSRAVTNEADFSGKGVAGGLARGVEGGRVLRPGEDPDAVSGDGPVGTGSAAPVYLEHQVEMSVIPRGGDPPVYPEVLRRAGIEGRVLAQYVVDTAGRAEPASFTALESSHELFTQAVRNSLPGLRFAPASVGKRKVRMLVQQTFAFAIQ